MDNEVRRTTQVPTATPANIAFFPLSSLRTSTPVRKVKQFVDAIDESTLIVDVFEILMLPFYRSPFFSILSRFFGGIS